MLAGGYFEPGDGVGGGYEVMGKEGERQEGWQGDGEVSVKFLERWNETGEGIDD